MYRGKKISVVIPAYNVETHLKSTIDGLPAMIDRIYVIDDGSTDNTTGVISESASICLLKHGVNKGPGAAMATGCLAALRDDMDVVVKLDGDGQMHPEQIENLILPIIEGKADYTKGDRLSNRDYRKTMPRFRLFGNLILTYLTRIASGYWHINDTQNGFVAMSKRALQSIDMETVYPYYGYLNDILVKLHSGGFTVRDVPMRAKYGQERSAIRLRKFVPKVSMVLLDRFFWRLKTTYLSGQPASNGRRQSVPENTNGGKHKKVLVKTGHPAHVHFFRNFILNMEKEGHEVLLCTTDKDVAIELLDAYGLKYVRIGASGGNPVAKMFNLLRSDYRLWKVARKFNPDILTGIMQVDAAHVSALLRKPSVIFDDTAHAGTQYHLYAPFASAICTPSCFRKYLGHKQVRYAGCHELAYLHPAYFKPDPSVLYELGLSEGDRFVILRFVAWKAIHDIGHHGLDLTAKRELVNELSKYARVLITAEGELPQEFEKYRITAPALRMLDLLYYATLYVGEGATMASECGVLGTPAIYFNPLKLDYLEEQEERYGLVFNFSETESSQRLVIEKALELVQTDNIKEEWRARAKAFLDDKIDVTEFITDFIMNYPSSFYEYKTRYVKTPEIGSNRLAKALRTGANTGQPAGTTYIHESSK